MFPLKFFIEFDSLFWLILVNSQNEAASLWVNDSINKDVKWTCMVP